MTELHIHRADKDDTIEVREVLFPEAHAAARFESTVKHNGSLPWQVDIVHRGVCIATYEAGHLVPAAV